MKTLKIQIALEQGKIMSGMQTNGVNANSVEDLLLIVGALENMKAQTLERLKLLASVGK